MVTLHKGDNDDEIIIIITNLLTAIGLSSGGSGYFTCTQI